MTSRIGSLGSSDWLASVVLADPGQLESARGSQGPHPDRDRRACVDWSLAGFVIVSEHKPAVIGGSDWCQPWPLSQGVADQLRGPKNPPRMGRRGRGREAPRKGIRVAVDDNGRAGAVCSLAKSRFGASGDSVVQPELGRSTPTPSGSGLASGSAAPSSSPL